VSSELTFSHFSMHLHERKLLAHDKPIPLGARAFDVLSVLVQRAGDLVTKTELFEQVWPGLVVEENNLQVHISTLRKFLGADVIATVAGRGYRFTARVSAAAADVAGSAPALLDQPTRQAAKPSSKPNAATASSPLLAPSASRSIAVLPFANLSGDASQEYFSDGLSEDIISKLTRSPWLYVIARNSSFAQRGPERAAADVCKALGVRYLVSGSVRKQTTASGTTLRISAELVDGTRNETLWSQRFDRPEDDLFEVQNAISTSIVSAIEPVYLRREEQLTTTMAAPDMRSWEWLMRARWHFWRSTREHIGHTQRCLANALEITPDDPAALSLMAFTHMSRVWAGWAEKPKDEIAAATRLALRAVRQQDTDANAHFTLGTALSFTGDYQQAIAELEYALTLYPQFASAAGELGRVLAFSGRTQEAAEYVLQAIDASPSDPHLSLWIRTRAIACYVDADYPNALRYAIEATAKRPDWFFHHYLSAAANVALGNLAAAQRNIEQAKTFGPYPMAALRVGHPFADGRMMDQFVMHLRKAGWTG
jgi:TolB-like protein/Tfp pilus assembly protein PilF